MLLLAAAFVAAPLASADPRVDYLLHCSGCHMPDGRGLAPVVPTLHDVPGRMLATPEGRSYLVRVPGVAQAPIDDRKLTEVLNWLIREFSADSLPEDSKPLTVTEVTLARRQLLADPLAFRQRTWPDL